MSKSISINMEMRQKFTLELTDRIFAKRLEKQFGYGAEEALKGSILALQKAVAEVWDDAQHLETGLYTYDALMPELPWSDRGESYASTNPFIGSERNGVRVANAMGLMQETDFHYKLYQIARGNDGTLANTLMQSGLVIKMPLAFKSHWGNERAFSSPFYIKKYKSDTEILLRKPKIMVGKDIKLTKWAGRNIKPLELVMDDLYKQHLISVAIWDEAMLFAKETYGIMQGLRNTGTMQNKFPDLFEHWSDIMDTGTNAGSLVPVADVEHVNKTLRAFKRAS